MNYILLLLILLLTSNIHSQEIAVGLSFRPTIRFSNSKNILPINNANKFTDVKSNTSIFNIEINMDFLRDEKIYHSPYFRYGFVKNNSEATNRLTDTIVYRGKRKSFYSIYTIGYGFGKYFKISKSNLFLNLNNSIYGGIEFLHSDIFYEEGFDYENVKTVTATETNTIPSVFFIGYEIKTGLLYRYKFIGLSLSFPVQLILETYNGNKTKEIYKNDLVNSIENRDMNIQKTKNTSFDFNYDIELSLKFYLKKLKKSK